MVQYQYNLFRVQQNLKFYYDVILCAVNVKEVKYIYIQVCLNYIKHRNGKVIILISYSEYRNLAIDSVVLIFSEKSKLKCK